MKYSRLVIAILITSSLACAKADKAPNESTSYGQEESTPTQSKILLELDVEALTLSEPGDELSITLADGSVYTLQIRQMEETMPGIVAISAYVNDQETGQATLILREGKLVGSVNMYSDGTSYELGFDEDSGSHYIIPINPDDRDVLPGGEPKIAPRGDQ
ncbi:MAG: hypothetical protein JJ971_03450 [Balneolaceae bacterium]|nr:hypothetical protein [Balneolaceae bacterium]MBO6545427.1 hypothetical protein [Balneolaceae bacterium]MBO6646823.1 hypothetical protein [Balneolaceae bacterium]